VAALVVAEEDVPGMRGAAKSSAAGIWARVSVSSGPMGTNCDEVQQAV
jgi:hypothetical protein